MADEIFNPDYRFPGQSVPTPDAPIINSGFNSMPLDNSPPDAPIIPVAGGGVMGNTGSIDPAADRVMAWWMSQDAQEAHGDVVRSQFDTPLNDYSLRTFKAPWYMPSGMLFAQTGRSMLWPLIGATLGASLGATQRNQKARGRGMRRLGYGTAGFFFPTLMTGFIALRAITDARWDART